MRRRYLVNFDTRKLPEHQADCVIIGGGVAGLFTAWHAARTGVKVIMITKHELTESNSQKAQGGIAAALAADDSPELHFQDTLAAGAGLCDEEAVQILVSEGREQVKLLLQLGVEFDHDQTGLSMTREGCHSRRRVLHAHGDATGAEIVRALYQQVRDAQNIEILESRYAVDLLVQEQCCYGVLVLNQLNGKYEVFRSSAVVLATGGAGQLYRHTTNPGIATADGIALAYRAGAEIMDAEFIQFHPTALAMANAPSFLISEAVRGEGGLLLDHEGRRFMPDYHELAELAPRDVVARAIHQEMEQAASNKVYLDLSPIGRHKIKKRFPNITATCALYGLDVTEQPIPVAPAAHYMMGGVKINLLGETSIDRLYCCGEASCSGVHGANRLASNSLLEGLVFGARIARQIAAGRPLTGGQTVHWQQDHLPVLAPEDAQKLRVNIQQVMSDQVGLSRTAASLTAAADFFASQRRMIGHYAPIHSSQMEVLNMLEAGSLICSAAAMRTESRGGHFRLDYPETVLNWEKHIIQTC